MHAKIIEEYAHLLTAYTRAFKFVVLLKHLENKCISLQCNNPKLGFPYTSLLSDVFYKHYEITVRSSWGCHATLNNMKVKSARDVA